MISAPPSDKCPFQISLDSDQKDGEPELFLNQLTSKSLDLFIFIEYSVKYLYAVQKNDQFLKTVSSLPDTEWLSYKARTYYLKSPLTATLHNVCAVHRGMFSTSGGYHEYSGGYHEYTGGCSVHRGDIMSTPGAYHDECGDIMSTPGMFSTLGDTMSTPGVYHDECGGYHEYTGGCSVHQGDIMSTLWCSVHRGVIMSTLGDTKMHVGVIMSTPGGVQYTGGIP